MREIKLILILSAFTLIYFGVKEIGKLPDGKLKIVFCNVGEGDAAYIRTPKGQDILIDAGPGDRVLSCLSRYMPFWDRTIELVFLSHTDEDHMGGLLPLIRSYRIKKFITGPVEGNSEKWRQLKTFMLSQSGIQTANLWAGGLLESDDGVKFELIWPTEGRVLAAAAGEAAAGSEKHNVSDGLEKMVPITENLNEYSLVLRISYGEFSALFLGDAEGPVQREISSVDNRLCCIKILKVPHHGSRIALDPEFLNKIHPETAVISVGKNNYGHPAANTLDLLYQNNINVIRTDQAGDVVIEK